MGSKIIPVPAMNVAVWRARLFMPGQQLVNPDDQWAVWSQIRAFHGSGSRGQREEGDTSQNPPRVTEDEGESYLEPAAGPDPLVAPLHLGEAEQGSPGTKRIASAASETWAAAPGVPPGAARGGL